FGTCRRSRLSRRRVRAVETRSYRVPGGADHARVAGSAHLTDACPETPPPPGPPDGGTTRRAVCTNRRLRVPLTRDCGTGCRRQVALTYPREDAKCVCSPAPLGQAKCRARRLDRPPGRRPTR